MLGLASLRRRWRNRNPDGEFRQGISAAVTESATGAAAAAVAPDAYWRMGTGSAEFN